MLLNTSVCLSVFSYERVRTCPILTVAYDGVDVSFKFVHVAAAAGGYVHPHILFCIDKSRRGVNELIFGHVYTIKYVKLRV